MQITDEMIEAALVAWYGGEEWTRCSPDGPFTEAMNARFVAGARRDMMAAISAAAALADNS